MGPTSEAGERPCPRTQQPRYLQAGPPGHTTLLPLCCVVGDDEINLPEDWSPPLPDYELDPSAAPLHRSYPVPALSSPVFLSASLLSATTTRAEPRHLDFEDP